MKSFACIWLSLILTIQPAAAQDAVRINLRDQLYSGMGGTVVIPISVMRDMVYAASNSPAGRNLHDAVVQVSPYTQLIKGDELIKKLQNDISVLRQSATSASFQQTSGSTDLVAEFSTASSDLTFVNLQHDLQRVATTKLDTLMNLHRALAPIQAGAIKAIIADYNNPAARSAALLQSGAAGKQLQVLLGRASSDHIDVATLQEQGDVILKSLNSQARALLGTVPTQEASIVAFYKHLADISSATAQSLRIVGSQQLPNLSTQQGLALLGALGVMNTSRDAFADALHRTDQQHHDLADNLTDGVTQLVSRWDTIPKDLAKSNFNAESLANGFQNLVGQLQGRQLPGVPALAMTLSAAGVFSAGSPLAQTSLAVTDLMSRKGDYTNAATGLISTLSTLNKAGISIPGIQQLGPVLSTANSILRAAGPLGTIAGLASGFSAFNLIGGLGGLGGGGGDEAVTQALAQINQKLDVMDRKLDRVIDGLEKLDDKITLYHDQEMHALEGITFEVVRTHELLTLTIHQQVQAPCLRATNPNDPDPLAQLNLCINAINNAFPGRPPLKEPPTALAFEKNVGDYNLTNPLEQTALDRWKLELQFRADLSKLLAKSDCQGLMYPSSDLEKVEHQYVKYSEGRTSSNCGLILQTSLVEPGITANYINWQQDAIAASAQLPRKDAIAWWQKNSQGLRELWEAKELPLLDQAIAQQAGISGDVLLPLLSKKLDDALDNAAGMAELKKVWAANGLLAENIARYWIWNKIRNGGQPEADAERSRFFRTLYSFAWESGDDAYWKLLTKSSKAVRYFVRPPSSSDSAGEDQPVTWMIQFGDLAPVAMAAPSEMNLLEVRWPSSLTDLVQARERVLEVLTGTELVEQTWRANASSARDILEAATVGTPKKQISKWR
jgi:hypothetical protein